jgi:Cu/Ag efflux pump CusA
MLMTPRSWGVVWALPLFFLVGFAWFTSMSMPGPQYANLMSLAGFAIAAGWAPLAFRKWRGTEKER